MLEKYKLMDAKTVSTPADPNVKLCKDDKVSKPVDATLYQSIVGSLLYLSTATRPDISQTVGVVAKFSSSPTEAHLTAVKRIMRYLKGSMQLLSDLKVPQDHPTVLMKDNQGAICIAKNPVSHARTKHIDVRYHYIREALSEETIELKYCPTNEMIADIFTKPLHKGPA